MDADSRRSASECSPFHVSDLGGVNVLVRVRDLVYGADVDPALVGKRTHAGKWSPGIRGHVKLELAENNSVWNATRRLSELVEAVACQTCVVRKTRSTS